MQFYIVIRDERWENVDKIKTAPLDSTCHKTLFDAFLILDTSQHVCFKNTLYTQYTQRCENMFLVNHN